MVIWKEFSGDLKSLYEEVGKEDFLVMFRFTSDKPKPFEYRVARMSYYKITEKGYTREQYQVRVSGIVGKIEISHYSPINKP